jgi:hypothetical protein
MARGATAAESSLSTQSQEPLNRFSTMGLEELEELVVSGEGLTTSDLQQIKERATLIREAQLEVRGTKRPAENDDPDSEYSKKSNIKYTQIETLQLRASL